MIRNLELKSDQSQHRQATWLELFFDLAFVLCVSALSHSHHALIMILPVWWVWNQYTWYSSHFDNDDLLYRAFMFLGIGGSLFLAKGIQAAQLNDFKLLVHSYLFLHFVLLLGWLRALMSLREIRSYILLKIAGICLGLLCWSLSLFIVQPYSFYALVFGVLLQLLMPVLAWTSVQKVISVHYTHIQERHGLFAIIIIGEGLLNLSNRLEGANSFASTLGSLTLIFSTWWIYFKWQKSLPKIHSTFSIFVYNYGHLVIYISLGLCVSSISHDSVRELGLGLFLLMGSLLGFRQLLLIRAPKEVF